MNIVCQSKCCSKMPEIGFAMTEESGTLIMNSVFAFARSARVNQCRIRTMIAVISPPSHRPTATRLSRSSNGVCTQAVESEAKPQAIDMQKMSLRTLQVPASRPAGICRTM